jgi:hypothetical protein
MNPLRGILPHFIVNLITTQSLRLIVVEIVGVDTLHLVPLFLEDLWQFFEPILGPFLNPLIDALGNVSFRATILSTIVTFFISVTILVFFVYEAPSFFGWIFQLPVDEIEETRASRQAYESKASSARRLERTKKKQEKAPPKKRPSIIEDGGVRVSSNIERKEGYMVLSILIENLVSVKIDMVAIDLELPERVETAIGDFRMQRLGTIEGHSSKTGEFRLINHGGDLSELSGYVEFLSATAEISKVELPAPSMGGVSTIQETDE